MHGRMGRLPQLKCLSVLRQASGIPIITRRMRVRFLRSSIYREQLLTNTDDDSSNHTDSAGQGSGSDSDSIYGHSTASAHQAHPLDDTSSGIDQETLRQLLHAATGSSHMNGSGMDHQGPTSHGGYISAPQSMPMQTASQPSVTGYVKVASQGQPTARTRFRCLHRHELRRIPLHLARTTSFPSHELETAAIANSGILARFAWSTSTPVMSTWMLTFISTST